MTLHHGDCLEVMAGMDPESVDAIVTDPSDCPVCGEWRDSPDADCAACGYDGRTPDQIDDDLDAMAPGNFI